ACGVPYAAVLSGASHCMPDRWLEAEPLVRFIHESRPTMSAAVPTVWNDVLAYPDKNPEISLDSIRPSLAGGSALPVSLQKPLEERHGMILRQAWGMPETSPLASAGLPPLGVSEDEHWRYRGSQGRVLAGVEARIVDDEGNVAPADGQSL